ncbi:MAG: HAMP domain-containing histidine kinase [bacterium]|nr:HAMP domain-containing histidine kinase [bacterium]
MKIRLKIAEQILIVLTLALILPLFIASAIIINTNQIAVRKELIYSANIVANSVGNELVSLRDFEKHNIYYANEALKKIPNEQGKEEFLQTLKTMDADIIDFSNVKLPRKQIIPQKFSSKYIPSEEAVEFSYVDINNILTTKKVSLEYINKHIFDDFAPQGRQIYIFDRQKNLLMGQNEEKKRIKDILATFPDDASIEELIVGANDEDPEHFGKYKNQPNVITYIPEYDWFVVVSSPKSLTHYGIIEARRKIILTIIAVALAVFIVFGIYTFALYTNIRQFFKIIRAIADGNYNKKLRVIQNLFTAQEIIFIAEEFNKMLEKIDESYSELNASNKKLKKMDEYKSNLIDTVSHEFRTPLTSIKGYASSLLRHDIHIDDEARKKSLRIIKQQAERLSRMVEDLLVIPDIEASSLRMDYKEVNVKAALETSMISTSKDDDSLFNIKIDEGLSVYADEDRLIQILINLIENALKYSKENTPIDIISYNDGENAVISVHNEADFIEDVKLNELFEKFTRVDSNLTRTTRGTGLGLFIVKGLVETMGGKISLSAKDGFEVRFTLPLYKGQDNE